MAKPKRASRAKKRHTNGDSALPKALVAWRHSTLGWTLRIAVIAVLAGGLLFAVLSFVPWSRTSGFGVCTDTIESSSTYAPSPSGTNFSYRQVPRTESEVHECGLPTVSPSTVAAFFGLIAIMVIPELVLHFRSVSITVGGTKITADMTKERKQAIDELVERYNPERPRA